MDSSVIKWEANVLSYLNNIPNIPRFYYHGHEESCDYLVMEYLKGEDMSICRDKIRNYCDYGLIPCSIAIYLTIQMLESLKDMHQLGFIHRDIKPSNFVKRNKNCADFCMIDFGLAKQVLFLLCFYYIIYIFMCVYII